MTCEHMNFESSVNVCRLSDADGGHIKGYSAEITIRCAECKTEMQFIGVPTGSSPQRPMVNFGSTELRVPIAPVGTLVAADEISH